MLGRAARWCQGGRQFSVDIWLCVRGVKSCSEDSTQPAGIEYSRNSLLGWSICLRNASSLRRRSPQACGSKPIYEGFVTAPSQVTPTCGSNSKPYVRINHRTQNVKVTIDQTRFEGVSLKSGSQFLSSGNGGGAGRDDSSSFLNSSRFQTTARSRSCRACSRLS
ncbi:MAG: hypothetical protein ACI8P0_005777 [Planctomycetaceae bacterium]